MYINGYVIAVPEGNRAAYRAVAEKFATITKDYGVLEIMENWEVHIPDGDQTDFRKAVKAEPDEKIVFSWVIWPDKETATTGHKRMMEDDRMKEFGDMPFDGKRMIFGDFEPLFALRQNP